MRRPHCCPICNDFSVETVLQDYAVTARVKEEDWAAVNALDAFKCSKGHIFFLRRTDLVPEPLQAFRVRSTG